MRLREARRVELADFVAMERQADTAGFILPAELAEHEAAFDRGEVIYLAIDDDAVLAGFILLAPESGGDSVEFRRIVVRDKGRGAGQWAIRLLEDWCRERWQSRRIWLDVFEFNKRGRHVYEKLGYRQFDSRDLDGTTLCFYEKRLA